MCTCFFLFNRARDLFITARLHNHYFAKSVKKKHIMKKKTCVLKGIWSILFPYTHGGWKINEKSCVVSKFCAHFARSFWWLETEIPINRQTMSGISPVWMITIRDPITIISFTLLINLAMQFLQSFRVGVLHCFFTWHDLFIENFLLGFGGVVVTLTFMLHCLLQ